MCNYEGVDLAVGQSQNFTFQNALGCDSVVTVTVAALPVSSSSLAVKTCPGTLYNYASVDLAVGQSQNFTFQNALGCDSVVTVTVTALPVSSSSLAVKTCPGTLYNYNGVNLAVGQSQQFTLQNAFGCDSVVTVTVTALPVSSSSLSVKTCPGTLYNYNGVNLAVGQSQQFTLQNAIGCDSVVTVTVAALPVSSSSIVLGVCPGEQQEYQGALLAAGDTQDFILTNWQGCDSTVTVTIFEKAVSAELLEVKICPNDVYLFNGTAIAPGEVREFHYFGVENCDSSITVVVTAWPELDFQVETKISCPTSATGSLSVVTGTGGQPASFSLNNIDFQTTNTFDLLGTGDYTVYVQDQNGCVSEDTAHIDALPRLGVEVPAAFLIPCDSSMVTLQPVISGDTTNLQFKWSNGAQTPALSLDDAAAVWLEVSNHCETVRREIKVNWAELAEDADFVYVPNVFFPAAENIENRLFRSFFAQNVELLDYNLEVFDRWGNLLFQSQVPEAGWEGPFRDKNMLPGVYVWWLRAHINFCGRTLEIKRQGDVTIVR